MRDRLGTGDGRFDFAAGMLPHRETTPPSRRLQGLVAADSLARRPGAGPAEPEAVDEPGIESGVSSLTIRRRIENHGIAPIVEW